MTAFGPTVSTRERRDPVESPSAEDRTGGFRRAVGIAAGTVAGALLGFYLTLTIFVAQARAGQYVYSFHDIREFRWQAVPTLLGVVLGAWLGWRGLRPLGTAVLAVLVCAALSIPLGWFAGGVIWEGRSAPWAGAVLAAGLGVVVGASVAAFRMRTGLLGEDP